MKMSRVKMDLLYDQQDRRAFLRRLFANSIRGAEKQAALSDETRPAHVLRPMTKRTSYERNYCHHTVALQFPLLLL